MNDFLAEIAANREDDLARLVYADWLEERGDPLGEFIRVQCALARTPGDLLLQAREAELLRDHRADWVHEVLPFDPTHIAFRRGFIDALAFVSPQFERGGENVFSAAPLVTSLTLQDAQPGCPELELIPPDVALTSLELLNCEIGFLDSRQLTNRIPWTLDSLSIHSGQLTDDDLAVLARAEHLKRVRTLELTRSHITDEGVTTLADVWQPDRLEVLNLHFNPITDTGLGALVSSPALSRLRSLDLSGARIQLRVPWGSPAPLPHLKHLDLSDNALQIAGPRMLGDCVTSARLKTLNLSNCGLEGSDVLAIMPLRVLTELELSGNPLGDAALTAVAENRKFRLLRALRLHETGIGDIAAQALMSSTYLTELQELVLTGNDFSSPCERALRRHFGSRVILDQDTRLV